MTTLSRTTAMALALGLLAAVPAGAAGTSSNSSTNTSSNAGRAADDNDAAVADVKAGNYGAAIPLLQKVVAVSPRNPDALNYLGFSYRKTGKTDEALAYYQKALDLQPKHLGANEYLGELYLELKNLPKAEERLSVLQQACGACEEYGELKEKVEQFKKTGQTS